MYLTFLNKKDADSVYFDGKKDPKITSLFDNFFISTNKYITFYQPYHVRKEYIGM